MVTFNQSGTISAPAEKVFAYISNPQKIPEWRKDVPGISQISGTPSAGTTFYEDVNFMGKKKLLMKIIEFISEKRSYVLQGSDVENSEFRGPCPRVAQPGGYSVIRRKKIVHSR